MSNKQALIVTGMSGMIGDRFYQLYQHKFDFENIDITNNIDITDASAVMSAVKKSSADIILHLAAFTNVDEAFKQTDNQKGTCYSINVLGTQNIVKAAKKYNKYVIHISTDFVFDGTKKKPYTEEDKPNPIEWYGKTKLMAEEYVHTQLAHYSIVRTSFPFRSNYDKKPDLVRKVIDGLKKGTLPPMFTDNKITPTFVDDLCKVFFMFTLKRPRGIWHATGSSSLSSYELAQLIKKTFDLKGTVKEGSLEKYLADNKGRPYQKNLTMSNRKLQDELGNPMLPAEQALMIMKTQM